MIRLIRVPILLLLILGGRVAWAESTPIDSDEDYRHPSGLILPLAASEFRRSALTSDNAELTDITGGYVSAGGGIQVSVHIYPEPPSPLAANPDTEATSNLSRELGCMKDMMAGKKALELLHPDAKHVATKNIHAPGTTPQNPWYFDRYRFEDTVNGDLVRIETAVSERCYISGSWAIQYRFTYPADDEAREAVAGFMNAVPLGVPKPSVAKGREQPIRYDIGPAPLAH